MDKYTTLVGGVRVSRAEQEAMVCDEVHALEAERNEILDKISQLTRAERKARGPVDLLAIKCEQQVLRKLARAKGVEIDTEIARQTALREGAR